MVQLTRQGIFLAVATFVCAFQAIFIRLIGRYLTFIFDGLNYLGFILNADNKMNIKIVERIAKGNKAYCANAKLIKSKFLKKNTKMKIYKTMIRPVVTCSSET
jgi:hypothetical protein